PCPSPLSLHDALPISAAPNACPPLSSPMRSPASSFSSPAIPAPPSPARKSSPTAAGHIRKQIRSPHLGERARSLHISGERVRSRSEEHTSELQSRSDL